MPGPPQPERSPAPGSLRAARMQILAAASRRGLRDVRVFGSVARGEAVETSDVDLLVAPGPDTTLFDLSGFALDVEEIVGRHVDVATPRGLKARIRDRRLGRGRCPVRETVSAWRTSWLRSRGSGATPRTTGRASIRQL